jgi:hypothetical protein
MTSFLHKEGWGNLPKVVALMRSFERSNDGWRRFREEEAAAMELHFTISSE